MKFMGSIYPIFLLLLQVSQLPDTLMREWNRQILDQTLCTIYIVLVLLYMLNYFVYRIVAFFILL